MTFIYQFEEEYRKDYVSKWIKDNLSITTRTSFKDYRSKIYDLLDKTDLTGDISNLQNYISGEDNQEFLLKDTYNRIKKEIIKEKEKEFQQDNFRYKKLEKKQYEKSLKKTTGYISDKQYKVYVEKYLKDGKIQFRYRNNKGQFTGLIKKDRND